MSGAFHSGKPTPNRPARWPVVLAIVGLLSAPVQAQPASPGPRDEELARAHYEKGTAAYALGDFAEAALQYETAFRLKLDSALLFNAAQAHRRAGNRQRAIELYENMLRMFPNARNHDVARQHLSELRRAAARTGAALTPAGASRPPPPPATTPPPADPRPATPARSGAGGALAPPPLSAPAVGGTPPDASGNGAPGWKGSSSPAGAAPPILTAPASEVAPAPALHRRPWFWVAVGGVVAAGLATTFLLSRGDPSTPKASWGQVGAP